MGIVSSFRFSNMIKQVVSSLLLLTILAPFMLPTMALGQVNQPAGDCRIVNAVFTPVPVSSDLAITIVDQGGKIYRSGWFNYDEPPQVITTIQTENCTNQEVKLSLMSKRYKGSQEKAVEAFDGVPISVTQPRTELLFQAGEEYCHMTTQAERQPLEDAIINIVSTNRQELFARFINPESEENAWLSADAMYQVIKSEFLDQYTTTTLVGVGDVSELDYYAKLLNETIFYDNLLEGAIVGVSSTVVASIGGLVTFVAGFFGGVGWVAGTAATVAATAGTAAALSDWINFEGPELEIVETLDNFLVSFLSSPSGVTFPTPCDYFIQLENSNGTVSKADSISNRLRYHCDPGSFTKCYSTEKELPWKFIAANTNLGGIGGIDPSNPCYDANTADNRIPDCQELLAPLPGFGDRVDENLGLGEYINTLLQMIIGFMGIIAVLMIIAAGVKYMTTENFGGKADAKATITNAFLGLLVAVSIFIILSTINPDLLNLNPRIEDVKLGAVATVDNENPDDATAVVGPGFALEGTFKNPIPSQDSANLAQALQELEGGAKIENVIADVGSGNQTSGTIFFYLDTGTVASAPISTGAQGVAEEGQGVSSDEKTPKGTFTIGGETKWQGSKINARITIAENKNNAVMTNNLSTNMGAAFIGININPYPGNYRAIGIHGNAENTLRTTLGCLRMYNNDLLIVAPYLVRGTPITIE